jgi:SnoaL-like domain
MIDLPKIVARYFEAERTRDVGAQTRCFSTGAVVHDEGREYRGLVAITDWKRAVQAKFEYECEPLAAEVEGDFVSVLVRLTGNFPGSPVELDHQFTLEGDKISALTIE